MISFATWQSSLELNVKVMKKILPFILDVCVIVTLAHISLYTELNPHASICL